MWLFFYSVNIDETTYHYLFIGNLSHNVHHCIFSIKPAINQTNTNHLLLYKSPTFGAFDCLGPLSRVLIPL